MRRNALVFIYLFFFHSHSFTSFHPGGGGVIAYTIYNTHTVHTLHLIARTYHVMFTSIHLRFPHFTCDHVSQQVMITPDNVAYYAQLFTLVT